MEDQPMTQTPQLRPLGAALGTEVLGIDLSKPLEAEHLRRDPGGLCRASRAGLPRSGPGCARSRRLRPPLRRAAPARADQVSPRRLSGSFLADQRGGDGRDRLVRRQARHGVAHRFDIRGRSAAAGHVAREGGALGERRHHVRRHARRLRRLARGPEAAAVRPHRPARPHQWARRRAPVRRRQGRDRQEVSRKCSGPRSRGIR